MQRNTSFECQPEKRVYETDVFYWGYRALLLNNGCKKISIAAGVPQCIKENIKTNQEAQNWYVGNVEEYKFQGKLVYAFNPNNKVIADGSSSVLTSTCDQLCTIGGFGGPAVNLCNGTNFYQQAIFVREVWNKYK